MAYSNWGAFVYKDGERRTDKEDVGVFDTDEAYLPSGLRIFANILKERVNTTNVELTEEERALEWARHSHHAVLGDGPVRLCGYKCYPELWVVTKEGVRRIDLPSDPDGEDLEDQSGEIGVGGDEVWCWWFSQFYGNMIDLKLIEPDGVVWTSRCGFEYGAGFMD